MILTTMKGRKVGWDFFHLFVPLQGENPERKVGKPQSDGSDGLSPYGYMVSVQEGRWEAIYSLTKPILRGTKTNHGY